MSTASEIRPAVATIPEVARYLAVSRTKVYHMMNGGHLPYVKIGRCRRVRWVDLEALLSQDRLGK